MAKFTFHFKNRQADYEQTIYQRDLQTGQFEKVFELIDFARLPFSLKVEKTLDLKQIQNGANQSITGPFKNKKRTYYTGMRGTPFPCLFHGNAADKSETLFLFSGDFRSLAVFSFTGWRCFPSERTALYTEFMIHLRKRGFKFPDNPSTN